MIFQFRREEIQAGNLKFLCDENEFSGVKKVAEIVSGDFEKVFGEKPEVVTNVENETSVVVEFATIGKSELISNLNIEKIKGKRECYQFFLKDTNRLCVVGSDKRGTIYGLFHLSEIMGVSPLVNWYDVKPEKKEVVTLTDVDFIPSKEPSVRFRGFFINDEWPAFGNWTKYHFGDINAKAYLPIFELLLRLKGNYLWPAMWSGRFSVDGPGLASAVLADELGVVMGMSHHEPCLRHGEEYKYLRGKDSIYGDAWDFNHNREGITRFWEDGLKRSGQFENVITVGMRGEADSTILGHEATLKDNIDLLRDVLKTQNRLIREQVNEDLMQVPRMLALYKEVEPFFYGDENTEGLMGDAELDGVTLMLCDDNHGNLRTLPTEEMRSHNGGYGMYYHFDYHGSPISYEWVNSSSLYKTWEEMTAAYEFGIRDLWIVNVGDIFTNEFPLAFFLDLAYDYEKWGVKNLNSPKQFTQEFVDKTFGDQIQDETRNEIVSLLEGYTKIAHNRRPEAISAETYAPMAYRERETLQAQCLDLMKRATALRNSICKECAYPYYELVYYPLMANLNMQNIWLDTTYNHFLAKISASEAMRVAENVEKHLTFDEELVNELHTIHNKMWYGMGLSEHIGFRQWNEEGCTFPVTCHFKPSNKARVVAVIPSTGAYSEGSDWSVRELRNPDFLRPDCMSSEVYLYATSNKDSKIKVESLSDFICVGSNEVTVPGMGHATIRINVLQNRPSEACVGKIHLKGDYMDMQIQFPIAKKESDMPSGTFLWCDSFVSVEAGHFKECVPGNNKDAFSEIPGFGRTLSGMKVFPVLGHYSVSDAPKVSYAVELPAEGTYGIDVIMAPVNPVEKDNRLVFALQVNKGEAKEYNVIPEGYKITDNNPYWSPIALDNARTFSTTLKGVEGLNEITFMPITPGFVLEKFVIYKVGEAPLRTYFGPAETYRKE